MILDYKEDIELAIFHSNVDKLKMTLNREGIQPNYDNNYPISLATQHRKIDIVKALLEYPEVNPADNCNRPMRNAVINNQQDLILLLWNDRRVKNTLKNDDINLYNKLIKLDIKDKIREF
jgi:ABC-type antimicrobial peptide transport system ATPase subunit